MRKHLLVGALLLPSFALAQASKMSSEMVVESTATTPETKTDATSETTVKHKTDGSSTTVVEHKATKQASGKPSQSTHTKKTVERSPAGTVTKSETVADKK